MILRGIVNSDLEPRLNLRLRGQDGLVSVVDALVDTGYSGEISLPISVAKRLGSVRGLGGRIVLADGTSIAYDSYNVDFEWLGSRRRVAASAMGDDVVIGMGLLSEHALMIEATVGGAVTIVPLMNAM